MRGVSDVAQASACRRDFSSAVPTRRLKSALPAKACATILLVLVTVAFAKVPVRRAAFASLEKYFDGRLEGGRSEFLLLGTTRGIYLDGFGAVFTSEVNLVPTAGLSPFKQTVSKEEVNTLHERKLQRLATLKQSMRDMMYTAATTLDEVGPDEQIVVGVSLFYFSWEARQGLPAQIVMQCTRQKLQKKNFDSIQAREF